MGQSWVSYRRGSRIMMRGTSKVLTLRGGGFLSPKFVQNGGFPLKLPKTAWFWKKMTSLGTKGGPGPKGPHGSATGSTTTGASLSHLLQTVNVASPGTCDNWQLVPCITPNEAVSCSVFWISTSRMVQMGISPRTTHLWSVSLFSGTRRGILSWICFGVSSRSFQANELFHGHFLWIVREVSKFCTEISIVPGLFEFPFCHVGRITAARPIWKKNSKWIQAWIEPQ